MPIGCHRELHRLPLLALLALFCAGAGLLAPSLLSGCTFDPSGLAKRIACRSDADCLTGFRCSLARICRPSQGDSGAVVAGDAGRPGDPADARPGEPADLAPPDACCPARPDLGSPDAGGSPGADLGLPAELGPPADQGAPVADAGPAVPDGESPVVDLGPQRCRKDEDCPERHVCQSGRCLVQVCWGLLDCWDASAPPGGYLACFEVSCGPCSGNAQCKPEGVCREGRCYQACAEPV
ncbi:MAG: hypothetical protein FJ125_14200, partial [Deltaproteobacteria bacterium]|nr:hypothetical protein [Deltaproteobacteria bacterium]